MWWFLWIISCIFLIFPECQEITVQVQYYIFLAKVFWKPKRGEGWFLKIHLKLASKYHQQPKKYHFYNPYFWVALLLPGTLDFEVTIFNLKKGVEHSFIINSYYFVVVFFQVMTLFLKGTIIEIHLFFFQNYRFTHYLFYKNKFSIERLLKLKIKLTTITRVIFIKCSP